MDVVDVTRIALRGVHVGLSLSGQIYEFVGGLFDLSVSVMDKTADVERTVTWMHDPYSKFYGGNPKYTA